MDLNRSTATIWAIGLLAAGFASNLFLTCGSNLVAFGAVAALTLGLRRGALVALGIWLESQLLGFAVFHYPPAALTVAWGFALGAGTLLAAAVANAFASRGGVVAFAAAFSCYEAALAAFSLATGGGLAEFTPAIVGQLLVSNVLVAVAAVALHRAIAARQSPVQRRSSRLRLS